MNVFQATIGNKAYPPDTGGYQRTHGLLSSFPEHDHNVFRYCCTGPTATYYAEGEFIEREVRIRARYVEYRCYSLLHDIPKAIGLLGYTQFAWPAVFRTRSGDNLLSRAREYDIAIADNPYLALFLANNLDIPTVYSSHNVEYRRYLSTSEGKLSRFFGNRLRRIEQQASACVDLVVCTTEADRDVFSEHAKSVAVIPNGIDADTFADEPVAASREEYGIPLEATVAAFLGSNYGPNVEAAKWLSENWHRTNQNMHLLVLGSAGRAVDDTADSIHTTGYVDDLQAALGMANIALNPIFSGGGSNVKLIEYFAASLPIVSTPFGARGFDIVDREHLILAEKEEFFDSAQELFEDELLRESIGKNGYKLAERRYTWDILSEQFHRELLKMI